MLCLLDFICLMVLSLSQILHSCRIGIFLPNVNGPQLHVLVHAAEHLLPVSLCPLVPVEIKDQGIVNLGLRLHIQLVFHLIRASAIQIMLSLPFKEFEILVESLPEESLAHSLAGCLELVLLAVSMRADAEPPLHGHTQLPIVELANSLIHQPTLGSAVKLLVEPKHFLVFHCFNLHLLIDIHNIHIITTLLLILLVKGIRLPVIEVRGKATFGQLSELDLYFVFHCRVVVLSLISPLTEVGKEPLAHHVTHDGACPILTFREYVLRFVVVMIF